MPRHRAWNTGYAQRGSGRFIGDCLTEGCPGELRVGSDGTATVIACGSLCGAIWLQERWLELAELLQEHAKEEALCVG